MNGGWRKGGVDSEAGKLKQGNVGLVCIGHINGCQNIRQRLRIRRRQTRSRSRTCNHGIPVRADADCQGGLVQERRNVIGDNRGYLGVRRGRWRANRGARPGTVLSSGACRIRDGNPGEEESPKIDNVYT